MTGGRVRLEPVTVASRGRLVVVAPAELEAELERDGPFDSIIRIEAVIRASDRERAIERLRRAVRAGDVGVRTMHAVYGLVRLAAAGGAADVRALAERLGGSPGAIARAAAFLVEDRVTELAQAAGADPLLLRHSPQPYLHLPRVPAGAPALFAVWLGELERGHAQLGSQAFRAFLGDVAEAAFRSLQHGAQAPALLGPGAEFLVDAIASELGGTTDFLAARGMAWLLGTLEPEGDTARAAIERARERFRDAEFQHDCDAMLSGKPWPPR